MITIETAGFYQFQAERTDQFTWEYLEQGLEAWRVRMDVAEQRDSSKARL